MSKKPQTVEELLGEGLVTEEEQPYEVPENWIWTKLGTIGEIGSSKRVLKSDWKSEGIPFYRAREIVSLNKNEKIKNGIFISEELYSELALKYGIPNKGDLLITAVGTIGQPYVVKKEDKFYFKDASVIWFKNNTKQSIEFVNLFFKSSYAQNQIKSMSTGTTVDTYTISNAKQTLIPLPPLNEQKRIAEKVERLLNKIEEAKQLIEEAKGTFELRRAAILDKAFRGELTAKWRDVNLSGSSETREGRNGPFEIPPEWEWTTIGEITSFVGSGSTPKGGSEVYQKQGIPFIRSQNVLRNKMSITDIAYITEETHASMKRTHMQGNETLLNITGASIGRAAKLIKELVPCNINQHVCALRFIEEINEEIPQYWLNSPLLQKIINELQIGATRQALNFPQVKSLPYPRIPPEEQTELLRIIENLLVEENNLALLGEVYNNLETIKQSILSKAFRGELGTNDPTEENAIELLKEVLQEQIK